LLIDAAFIGLFVSSAWNVQADNLCHLWLLLSLGQRRRGHMFRMDD